METNMTPAVIMACGNTRLEKRLKDCGVRFVRSDIGGFDDLMETISDTSLGATHAIIHQRLIFGKPPKKALEQIKRLNPELSIILITPKATDELTIKKYLSLGVELIEDNSAALPQILLSKLNIQAPPAEPAPSPSAQEPEEPAVNAPVMQAEEKPVQVTVSKEKRTPIKRSFQLPSIANAIASIKPSRPAMPKTQPEVKHKVPKQAPAPNLMPDVVPKRAIVIAIYCTTHGAGGTWLSTQIAYYLSQKGKTAVSGGKDICFISKKKYKEGDPHFSYREVDFFAFTPLQDILSFGYQYIVIDAGVPLSFSRERHERIDITPTTLSDVMRADLRLCISEFSPWSDFVLQFYMSSGRWSELMQRSILTLSNRCTEDVSKLLNTKFGRVFLPLPRCTPFEMNEEMMDLLNEVLTPHISIMP